MALTVSIANDDLLEEEAQNIYDSYKYITVGTGASLFNSSTVQLTTPVEITTPNFNKEETTDSYITGRSFVKFFRILSGEPVSQPVNIAEVGLVKTSTNTPGPGIYANLSVAQTKDNTVQHKWRASLRVNRQGE